MFLISLPGSLDDFLVSSFLAASSFPFFSPVNHEIREGFFSLLFSSPSAAPVVFPCHICYPRPGREPFVASAVLLNFPPLRSMSTAYRSLFSAPLAFIYPPLFFFCSETPQLTYFRDYPGTVLISQPKRFVASISPWHLCLVPRACFLLFRPLIPSMLSAFRDYLQVTYTLPRATSYLGRVFGPVSNVFVVLPGLVGRVFFVHRTYCTSGALGFPLF